MRMCGGVGLVTNIGDTLPIHLKPVTGIKPASSPYKGGILSLYYTGIFLVPHNRDSVPLPISILATTRNHCPPAQSVCVASVWCPEFPLFKEIWISPFREWEREPNGGCRIRTYVGQKSTGFEPVPFSHFGNPPSEQDRIRTCEENMSRSLLRAARSTTTVPALWCQYLDATPGLTPETGSYCFVLYWLSSRRDSNHNLLINSQIFYRLYYTGFKDRAAHLQRSMPEL